MCHKKFSIIIGFTVILVLILGLCLSGYSAPPEGKGKKVSVEPVMVYDSNGDLLGRIVSMVPGLISIYNGELGKFLQLEKQNRWENTLTTWPGKTPVSERYVWWWDPVNDDYYEFDTDVPPTADSYLVLQPGIPLEHFIISIILNNLLAHYEPVPDPAKVGQYKVILVPILPFAYPVQEPLQFE
jgi:hypothetical protein